MTTKIGDKSKNTKRRIFDSAKRLYEEMPFDEVTVDNIVEAAEVAKGSFYVHYNSKDELLAELLDDYVLKVDEGYKYQISEYPTGAKATYMLMDTAAKIADVMEHKIGYFLIRIVYRLRLTKENDLKSVVNYNTNLYSLIEEIINVGVKQGEFVSDAPAKTLAKSFIYMFRGITYEWCARYPYFDFEQEAKEACALYIQGIAKNKKDETSLRFT